MVVQARTWFAGTVAGGALLCSFAILRPGSTHAAEAEPGARAVYWTCEPLEPDSLASAWLLQRFVSPGCEIRVLPKGEVSQTGTPFDLPLVAWTRERTRSCFQVIREAAQLTDPALSELGREVDEIELRAWNSEPMTASSELETQLRLIIGSHASSPEQLKQAAEALEHAYAHSPSAPSEHPHG